MLSMQNQNGNLLSMNSDLHFVSGMSEARNYMTRLFIMSYRKDFQIQILTAS